MNRQQKETVIANLKEFFHDSDAAFVVNYKGLSVSQMQVLRSRLRECDGKLTVAKARLMKVAANGIEGIDDFKESFHDQVGLVFVKKEAPAVAKQLVNFAKEHEALSIVSGFFESAMLTKEQIIVLATLPSREELLARLAATLQAPIAGLARAMQQVITSLPLALKQVAEKKEKGEA